MNNMIWLIRREFWENRSLWIAPLVVAGVILVISAFGGIHVGNGERFLAWLAIPVPDRTCRTTIAKASAAPWRRRR